MLNCRIIWALGLPCLLAGVVFAQTTPPTAPPITPPITFTHSYTFPPVGLASGETAQVNVVNATQVPANATGTPPSCTGTISFLNASGAVIGTASGFTVGAGHVVSASLPYGSVGVAGTSRVEIRAEVQLTATASGFAPCSLSYTFETFDTATGVTHVFISGSGATVQPLFGR